LEKPTDASTAAASALAAWREARDAMKAANDQRTAKGLPTLDFGTTLHIGDVIYGNIGAPDRLDFTVIGPAVNLVSRMEDLTKKLGQPVLLSKPFADVCGEPTQALGDFEFKGIEKAQPVYGLA